VTRPRRIAAITAAMVLALSACTPGSDDFTTGEVDVDVDTRELRALKKSADVDNCQPAAGNPVDDGLPDVTLPCLGGGPDVDVAGLRGPMVVNFWASWCKPCRRELPYYQQFHQEYGDRVAVVGIDYNDTQPVAALELVRDTGVTFPLLADPGTELASEGLAIPGLPGIAFVDADGRMTHLMFDEIESLGELEELVEEHLGVTL